MQKLCSSDRGKEQFLKFIIISTTLIYVSTAELNVKARKEIAGYLAQNKDDRARIKVHHFTQNEQFYNSKLVLI